jgi:N-acetylmuramoyl-L-alanine amidase
MAVIVIDPGHGGTAKVGGSSANNATGPNGTMEKRLTLSIGLRAHDVLVERGHQVRMTRMSDVNLGLAARAGMARSLRAAAFVSIHFNASDDHSAQGTETWNHTRRSAASRRLAERVQARVKDATGRRDRGVKQGRLVVLDPDSHDSGTACCLLEVSFLDRADEEERLRGSELKDAIATAIADGIGDFLALGPQSGAVLALAGDAGPKGRQGEGGDCEAVTSGSAGTVTRGPRKTRRKRPAAKRKSVKRAGKRAKKPTPKTAAKRARKKTKKGARSSTRKRTARRSPRR